MSLIDLDKSGRIPQIVKTYCGPSVGWVQTDLPTSIEYVMSGGDSALTTGIKDTGLRIPVWAVINDWVLQADRVGSIVIDVWRAADGAYPPVVGGSICGSAKPTLSAQQYRRSAVLTGWSTVLNQYDTLWYNIDSTDGQIRAVTLILEAVRIIGQE